MKKNAIILSALISSSFAFSQVGINTSDPRASFDITAKISTGTDKTPEGLLIPRVDRLRAQSMSSLETSTLIYVNSVATGSQGGNAVNIDKEGYYYFDGALWMKLNADANFISSENIYNSDGALTTNRVVTQGASTLSFEGQSVNGFSIDNKTFSIDSRNHRIGFGTKTPSSKFEIVSDNEGSGAQNNFYFKGFGTSKEPSLLLVSSNGTEATPTNLANGDNIGSVYFGPRANNTFNTVGGSAINSKYRGDGTTLLTDLLFRTSNADRIRIDENGNVGIGTSAPSAKVDILGDTFGIKRAQGGGSWDNIWFDISNASAPSINASGAETGLQFRVGANTAGTYGNSQTLATVATMRPNGNMGIGTESPNNNAILELSATNKGFLPPRLTTAQRDAIPAASRPAGLMVYNTNTNCMDFWNSSTWVSTCAVTAPPAGIITAITCASATNNGTIVTGSNNSVSSSIPYTGGNGGSHGGQTVASTGVTGLTAILAAGSFANGAGSLNYIITGTPSSIGTANFAIIIGGQTCTLSRTVTFPVGTVSSLNCAAAINNGTLTGGTAASGVSSVISYTGGNTGTYGGQVITSTGVTGLTATLTAGAFANGNGNLTYNITGTPSGSGTANFAINIGGQTCSLSRTVNATAGTVTQLNCTSTTQSGTLTNDSVASGVTATVPYTGGNGGTYAAQSIQSTGVPGLTATISAGSFVNGNGNLTFTISGKPLGEGTASFALNIGGKICTFTITVNAINSGTITCSSPGYYPYPNVNNKYFQCVLIGGKYYYYVYTCPAGAGFNPATRLCEVGYGQ